MAETKTKSDLQRGARILAIRENARLASQQAFAEALVERGGVESVTRGAVGNWENGGGIKLEMMAAISRAFGVPVDWIATGANPPSWYVAPPYNQGVALEEPTHIPVDENGLPMEAGFYDGWKPKLPGGSAQIDAEVGTGEGSVGEVLVIESRGIVSGHRVTDEWVVPRSVLGANPANIIIIPVVGTSMEPSLTATDLVFVDRTATNVRAGEVYVIDEGDGPMAKRVRIDRSEDPATLIIISENPAVPPYPRPAESIRIIGRVVGKYCKM